MHKSNTNSKGYGSDEQEKWNITASTRADLQPYSGGLAQKQYGLDTECQKRMYCAVCHDISEGEGVSIDSQDTEPEYLVTYVEQWDTYTMALLKRR